MKISTLMKEYLENSHRVERAYNKNLLPESFHHVQDLPVLPSREEWVVLESPSRLARTYNFQNVDSRNAFLGEVLEAEASHGHYGKVTMDGLEVTVEVWTHDLDMVTELDKEYARDCDAVFRDISLMKFGGR